jgi:sterol desaturase/sphingolipid hydroxylase (fatty acid hydroxylase superfamily)
MSEMASFLTAAGVLTTLYAVVFVLERIPQLSFRPMSFRRRFLLTDLTWYGIVVGLSAMSILLVRPAFERLTIEPLARNVHDLPAPVLVLLALVLFDLVAYGVHRALHGSDLLWSLHKVHHSTLELDGLAATRQHMMENLVRFVPSQFAMFLIGIPTTQVAIAVAVGAAFAILGHSNLGVSARWLEMLVVTPRTHRRHHIPSTTLTNFGGVFTIWDRLLGTFISVDTAAHERFGCPGEIDSYPQRFVEAAFRPPREIRAVLRSRRSIPALETARSEGSS